MSDLVIRELHELTEMDELRRTAGAVWGGPAADMVSSDFLMALSHVGGYVTGGFVDDRMVACSFGMLARHGERWCLHSHITGVLPDLQNAGFGARMKFHQRGWARDKSLSAITWTFDPLVRRNGWFNLQRLGARAIEFHVNFYGALNDDINGSGETDRLLAWWDVHESDVDHGASGSESSSDDDKLVATPEDIVALRRTDPGAAQHWRESMRAELLGLMADHTIIGMNDKGEYVARTKEKLR